MNVFPDTETYNVTWLGGSCGAFITALIYQFVVKPTDNFTFSKFGHAHGTSLDECERNWKNINSIKFPELYNKKIPVFLTVDPIIPSKSLILFGHTPPDLDELHKKYPLCKSIVIEIDKRTINRVQGNLFFKTLVENFPGSMAVWTDLQNKHPYFRDYSDPRELPIELSERYIKDWGKLWPFINATFFTSDFPIPEKYQSNVFHINVYDIIYNQDFVLETISKITSKPIVPSIVQYYNAYLSKQEELVKAHMPWLDDK